MSKYKVGDKVIIREDLEEDRRYGTNTVIDDMLELCGEVVTIETVRSCGEYYIEEDESDCSWTDEMIKGLASEETNDIQELLDILSDEPTNKFKVGDIVRVKDDLVSREYYGDDIDKLYFSPHMDKFRGVVSTIVESYTDSGVVRYKLGVDKSREWVFNDAMLEFANKEDVVEEVGNILKEEVKAQPKGLILTDIDFSYNGIYKAGVGSDIYIVVKDGKMELTKFTSLSTSTKISEVNYEIKSLHDMVEYDGEIKDRKVKIISDIIKNDVDLTPEQQEYFIGFQNLKNILEQITGIYECVTAVKILLKSNFYVIEE